MSVGLLDSVRSAVLGSDVAGLCVKTNTVWHDWYGSICVYWMASKIHIFRFVLVSVVGAVVLVSVRSAVLRSDVAGLYVKTNIVWRDWYGSICVYCMASKIHISRFLLVSVVSVVLLVSVGSTVLLVTQRMFPKTYCLWCLSWVKHTDSLLVRQRTTDIKTHQNVLFLVSVGSAVLLVCLL